MANLAGVTWNAAYNGYYDVSGNLYIFNEGKAVQAGEIASVFSRFLMQEENGDINPGNDIILGTGNILNGPTFTHYLQNGATAGSAIYALLSPLIPNIGDRIVVSGAMYAAATFHTLSQAHRNGATTIQLNNLLLAGTINAIQINAADATTYSISAAW